MKDNLSNLAPFEGESSSEARGSAFRTATEETPHPTLSPSKGARELIRNGSLKPLSFKRGEGV